MLEQALTGTTCATRCWTNGSVAWSVDSCLSSKTDFTFLTPDCATSIVVRAEPPAETSWQTTTVLLVYKRSTLSKSYFGAPMLPPATVKVSGGHFVWLEGTPHYTRNGKGIELQVLTGMTARLAFDEGTRLDEETLYSNRVEEPEPPRARPPPRRAESDYVPRSATQRPAPAPEPPPPPRTPAHTGGAVVCDGMGCWIPAQRAPTIPGDPGLGGRRVCRQEGEGCGTNADCCGGNCQGGACR